MSALSTAVPKGKPEASPLGTAAESEPRGRPERAVQCGCMTQGSDQFSRPEERSVHPSYDSTACADSEEALIACKTVFDACINPPM